MKRYTTSLIFVLVASVGAITALPATVSADLVLVFRSNPISGANNIAELTGTFTGAETFSLDSTSGFGTPNATYTYTIGNIDAAEDGTANDSLTATFAVAAAVVGGTGNVVLQTDGNLGVSGNGAGNLNDVSESLTYTLQSSSVSLGDGGTASVTGGGFNQIRFTLLDSANETALLSGGTTSGGVSTDGAITGTTTFDPIASFTIGHNDDGSSFRAGPARYRFVITAVAVPEPTVVGLALAGLMGLAVRRKRIA